MIELIQKTKVSICTAAIRACTRMKCWLHYQCSVPDENCRRALEKLPGTRLRCQVHSTVMLSEVDRKIFRKLGVDLTCDPNKEP